jgi:hypothetical protein
MLPPLLERTGQALQTYRRRALGTGARIAQHDKRILFGRGKEILALGRQRMA